MMPDRLSRGCLVLYKSGPALVGDMDDKIEVTMLSGKSRRVREKDVMLLHPGPLKSLADLDMKKQASELEEAWELIREEKSVSLEELAELAYGEFTPDSAWGAWRLLDDQLWFTGSPDAIQARDRALIDEECAARAAKAAEKADREAFMERLRSRSLIEEDHGKLSEVEQLALNRIQKSKILQSLGIQQGSEAAHRFLLETGYWPGAHNPHPQRMGLPLEDPPHVLPSIADEPRLDLTHLPAFAIDDEGSNDPDDAISLDGDRIWVHVADVAAMVQPDSELDQEARARAANLYLPDRIVHMLPPGMTHQLALGLQETSPALSFGFRLDQDGQVSDLQIEPSLVRVTRHTYAEIDRRMDESPFAELRRMTGLFAQRRDRDGAARLDLPEVRIRVSGEQIDISPLQRLASRDMVTELMLMAGEATALLALERDLAIPFATQPAPDKAETPETLSQMHAFRRKLRPGRHSATAEPHAGLGLRQYARATSPLRRYLDLVTHQQLRALVRGESPLSSEQIAQRIAISDPVSGQVRRAERLSNQHWKLLWLTRNPDWQGEGVVVEREEQRMTLMIPQLAMETRIRSNSPPELDSRVRLAPRDQDITSLSAWFRIL